MEEKPEKRLSDLDKSLQSEIKTVQSSSTPLSAHSVAAQLKGVVEAHLLSGLKSDDAFDQSHSSDSSGTSSHSATPHTMLRDLDRERITTKANQTKE